MYTAVICMWSACLGWSKNISKYKGIQDICFTVFVFMYNSYESKPQNYMKFGLNDLQMKVMVTKLISHSYNYCFVKTFLAFKGIFTALVSIFLSTFSTSFWDHTCFTGHGFGQSPIFPSSPFTPNTIYPSIANAVIIVLHQQKSNNIFDKGENSRKEGKHWSK